MRKVNKKLTKADTKVMDKSQLKINIMSEYWVFQLQETKDWVTANTIVLSQKTEATRHSTIVF